MTTSWRSRPNKISPLAEENGMNSTMDRVRVDGAELEVDVRGSGEPVVFIHGVGISDSFLPLVIDPTVRDHFRTIQYRRRGYGGSSPVNGPFSVYENANDCRAMLDALGVKKVHVVGQSYGGQIALQLAVDAPEIVATLALFEPVLLAVPAARELNDVVGPIVETYSRGDRVAAAHAFFAAACGPDWQAHVDRTLPGGREQAEKDVATLFECDLPAMSTWESNAAEVAAINQPVLYVLGSDTLPLFTEGRDLVRGWLPHMEDAVLANSGHLLQLQSPAEAAAALADFLKRHPVG
jgi:pimeloyl-ACP methyl ester carboxylesterase